MFMCSVYERIDVESESGWKLWMLTSLLRSIKKVIGSALRSGVERRMCSFSSGATLDIEVGNDEAGCKDIVDSAERSEKARAEKEVTDSIVIVFVLL